MNPLWQVLTEQSGRDLIRYKSFFLLVFGLMAVDRAVRRWLPNSRPDLDVDSLRGAGEQAAVYVFERLPDQVCYWLTDRRILSVFAGGFLLKQIISLWPSSDMRRMHRQERERFGLLAALKAIRYGQVVWDAVAVATICGLAGCWSAMVFFSVRIVLEALFVAAIPLGAILYIDPFWVRMPLAAISAAPVYAYLKRASFKFFLFTYGRFPLVREEYRQFFMESSTVCTRFSTPGIRSSA